LSYSFLMFLYKSEETPWGKANLLPSLEHELFFQFLAFSPSYIAVHLAKTSKKKIEEKRLISMGLQPVISLYEKLGNIYDVVFDEWWVKTGQYYFVGKNESSKVMITLDMTLDKKALLKELESLIDDYHQTLRTTNEKINFLKNKIQVRNLVFLRQLVNLKTTHIKNKNDLPDWRLGVDASEYWPLSKHAEVFYSRYPEIHISIKKLDKNKNNEKSRYLLGQLVSRQMREALYISENAARGLFPSKECLDTIEYGSFNYISYSKLTHDLSKKIYDPDNDFYRRYRPKSLNFKKWQRFEKEFGDNSAPISKSEKEHQEILTKYLNDEISIWDLN